MFFDQFNCFRIVFITLCASSSFSLCIINFCMFNNDCTIKTIWKTYRFHLNQYSVHFCCRKLEAVWFPVILNVIKTCRWKVIDDKLIIWKSFAFFIGIVDWDIHYFFVFFHEARILKFIVLQCDIYYGIIIFFQAKFVLFGDCSFQIFAVEEMIKQTWTFFSIFIFFINFININIHPKRSYISLLLVFLLLIPFEQNFL